MITYKHTPPRYILSPRYMIRRPCGSDIRGYLLLGMVMTKTNRPTMLHKKLRDYMSKNAPKCEGAFLVVQKFIKNLGKTY